MGIEQLFTYLISQLINGIFLGGIYAITALSFTLIYGVLHVLNFAHGEFLMIGAYVSYFAAVLWGLDPVSATIIAGLAGGVIGVFVYRGVMSPLLKTMRGRTNAIIATFGLSILLQNLAQFIFGPDYKAVAYYFPGTVSIGSIIIGVERIIIFLVALVILLLSWYAVAKTKMGLGIRAVAENEEMASIMGVNTSRILLETFVIATTLAAVAGSLLMPFYLAYPTVGVAIMFKVFAIVILGGMGSIEGTFLASFILGITEAAATVVVGTQWITLVTFAVLIGILILRPYGLLGRRLKR